MIISSAYILAAGKSKRIVPPIDVGGVYMRYAYAGFNNPYGTNWANSWGAASPSALRLNEYFVDENWASIRNETEGNPGAPIFGRSPQGIACVAEKSSTTTIDQQTPWPNDSLYQTVMAGGNAATFTLRLNKDPSEEDLISGRPFYYKAVLSLGLPNGKSGKFRIRRMIEVTVAANVWTDCYNWWSGMNVPIYLMDGSNGEASFVVFNGGTYHGVRNFNTSSPWFMDDIYHDHTDIIQTSTENWQNYTGTHSSIVEYDPQTIYDLGAKSIGNDKITYFFDEGVDFNWWVSPNFSAGQLYNSNQRKDLTFKDGTLTITTDLIPLYFGGIGIGEITGRLYDLAKDDVFVKVTITLTPVS